MSFSVPELEDAEVIFDIGYNAPVSHPLVARHIVRAKKKGCKIICVDPRLTETGRIATIYLPIKGGTNMLFLNAMAHVIVTEDLVDHDFIEKHTTGFADYAKEVASMTPFSQAADSGSETPTTEPKITATEYLSILTR